MFSVKGQFTPNLHLSAPRLLLHLFQHQLTADEPQSWLEQLHGETTFFMYHYAESTQTEKLLENECFIFLV